MKCHEFIYIFRSQILAQIQRYDNFILPVVESLKFMTPLSYDMLSYCIIVAISDAEKDKMKHDSTNLSTWLQSIATFCALAFKKYPIELIAMIQFVINQLKTRKSYDLLILQEIVQKMSGIEVKKNKLLNKTETELTDDGTKKYILMNHRRRAK
jgi:THO complex subunit 2